MAQMPAGRFLHVFYAGRPLFRPRCALNDVTQKNSRDAPHAVVVDDDALILMDATSILEDAGFQVLEAMNVAQALDVLERHHPMVQLLFTDVQMPGGQDGFDLARQTAERWPHIAVVVASGRAEPTPGRNGARPTAAPVWRKRRRERLEKDIGNSGQRVVDVECMQSTSTTR